MQEKFVSNITSLKLISNGRQLNIIFVIDISKSVNEEYINTMFVELVNELKRAQKDNYSVDEIIISVISFLDEARVEVDPINLTDYECKKFVFTGKNKELGKAYRLLCEKLSRNVFFANSIGKIARPIICLITDAKDKSCIGNIELDKLYANGWFINAARLVVMTEEWNKDDLKDSIKGFVSDCDERLICLKDAKDFFANAYLSQMYRFWYIISF